MKTKLNAGLRHLALMTLAAAGMLPALSRAEPPSDFVNSVLRSHQDAAKVPIGQTVAMVCTKCKTALLSEAKTKKGFLGWFQTGSRHECSGCGGELLMKSVPSGQGTVSLSEYVHTCTKCGDSSAFCCASNPKGGLTKGMEKKPDIKRD